MEDGKWSRLGRVWKAAYLYNLYNILGNVLMLLEKEIILNGWGKGVTYFCLKS